MQKREREMRKVCADNKKTAQCKTHCAVFCCLYIDKIDKLMYELCVSVPEHAFEIYNLLYQLYIQLRNNQ